MNTAIELIKAERERQVSAEGYDAQHDDEHTSGELADAGSCYAEFAARKINQETFFYARPLNKAPAANWPFTSGAWNPSDDTIRNLVKAGALIVAEIERLQRMGSVNDQDAKSPTGEAL